jgi:hypothetical protein
VFLTAAAIFCGGVVLSWFLKDKPLRTSATPSTSDAQPESAPVHV